MNLNDRLSFTIQLSTLLQSGTPLLKCLIIIRSTNNKSKKHWLDKVIQDIQRGLLLSQALRIAPCGFDSFYCGLLEIGEHSGQLDTLLTKISNDLIRQETLRSKLKKILTYPACVLFICLGMLTSMLIWVIPSFEHIFQSFSAQLPPLTQFLLHLSRLTQEYVLVFIFSFFMIALISCYLWVRSISSQRFVDQLFLKIPIFNKLLQHLLLARWTATIAILQQSGVPLLDAMRISARCSDNWVVHDLSGRMYQLLCQGQNIHTSAVLSDSNELLFDPMSIQLLRVGEESGSLTSMLNYLANFHEKKLDESLSVLMETIEPMLVIVMGLIVGTMVIALYLPLFQLGQIV